MRKVFESRFNHVDGVAKCLATATLFMLCGCTEEVQYEQIFSTDHFNYYVRENAEHQPCDGVQPWLERSYEGISKFLGVTLPPDQKIEYHLDGGYGTPGCINGFPCAIGTAVYSSQYFGKRDVAHVLSTFVGDPPLIFQEGLAEVLGCGRSLDSWGPIDRHELPIDSLIESKYFEDWADRNGMPVASSAGSFVRHLMDTYGTAKFLSFYAQAPRNGTKAAISAVFEQEFGVSLNDELWAWRFLPMHFRGDICMYVTECESTVPSLENGEFEFSCGPEGFGNEAVFRFQIGETQVKQFITEPQVGEPQAIPSVSYHRCAGGNAAVTATSTSSFVRGDDKMIAIDPDHPQRQMVLDAPAGDYFAWFYASHPATLDVQATDPPSPMRDGCSPAAEPMLLEAHRDIRFSSRWTERACQGFWCPGQSWDIKIGPTGGAIAAGPLTADGRPMYSPSNVYLCTTPCPATLDQCEQLVFGQDETLGAVSKQVFAPGTVVYVGAPFSPYPEHFYLHMRLMTE